MFLQSIPPKDLPYVTTVTPEPTDEEKITGVLKEFFIPPEPPNPRRNQFSFEVRMMLDLDIRPRFYYGMDLAVGGDDD